ncbi:MAG: methyltransferase domain-containing protein, partial [Xanthomonadales bacterium]|nr:methyltransferase domain-containing protein [Xanthomonadales bacterium]
MNVEEDQNIDHAEREKFDSVASGWWDPEGSFRPLHDLNPARLKFIADRAEIADRPILDVGCGGGILAESLARKGGNVTGIDVA